MSLIGNSKLTLIDYAKRKDPDGRVAKVAEILSQTNQILDDCVMLEGNLETGHQVTIRTGLPSVYFRQINGGVLPSKSKTAQVTEACGILEAFSEIDVDLAKLNGNTAEFRLSEDKAFLEAMNQTMAETMFYGNPLTDPKQFAGFAPRLSSLSAGNAQNILDGGGVGSDNTSIYLVGWGENSVFCPFPKGSEAGLIHEDLGIETVELADGGRMRAYRTRYQWKTGLVVKDWRFVVRIPNIDVSNLVADSSAANLINLMSRALDRIENLDACRPALYMNRTVYSMLRIQALNKSNAALAIEDAMTQFGTPSKMMTFMGVPIRKVDRLLNTEARIT